MRPSRAAELEPTKRRDIAGTINEAIIKVDSKMHLEPSVLIHCPLKTSILLIYNYCFKKLLICYKIGSNDDKWVRGAPQLIFDSRKFFVAYVKERAPNDLKGVAQTRARGYPF